MTDTNHPINPPSWFVLKSLSDAIDHLFASPEPAGRCGVRDCTAPATTGRSWLESDGGCSTLPLCESHLAGLHRSFALEAPSLTTEFEAALRWWYAEYPHRAPPIYGPDRKLYEVLTSRFALPTPPRCAVLGCAASGTTIYRVNSRMHQVCEEHWQWLSNMPYA